MTQRQRSSNIELLRIVAMLLIVAHHFSVHGGFSYDISSISINRVWIQFLQLGCKVGVDVFVLISGYYLVSSKSSVTFKAIKLWLQLLFYSIAIFISSIALDLSTFSKKAMLDSLFPVSMCQWWFASTYFILLLFTPTINIALTAMNKRKYQQMLLLSVILWCCMPSLSSLYPKFTIIAPQLSDLAWFVTLYAIGAYIRLWHPTLSYNSKYYLLVSIASFILTLISAVIFDYLNLMQQSICFNPTALFDKTSITILITSITALLGFLQINMSYSKVINTIASATFGVYLLHDQAVTRPLLWETIFKNASFADSDLLIIYSIAVILVVYLCCTLLDLVRIKVVETPLIVGISKLSKLIDSYIQKIFTSSLSDRL